MNSRRNDLTHNLMLPTLLFAALGGMSWAVRGCSGFGGSAGCIFAGVLWGAAWWYLAYDPAETQSRRYASAWIVLALTLGIGFSGNRGWMQWPSFFEGRLQTNYDNGQWLPISPSYGFLWLFIAGMPWAGLGACALAWCGSLRETHVWHWVFRFACGIGCSYLARHVYDAYPDYFLPLYDQYRDRYQNLGANPNLRRLITDCGLALTHLGFYLGFLLYEILRRDWKNSILILTVGVVNGAGWAAFQNWKWATKIWKSSDFNFWRCWESSGGVSIGVALGIAYFLVNRPMGERERTLVAAKRSVAGPNFEWFLIFCGVVAYLGLFLGSQTVGWSHGYLTALYLFAAVYYLAFRGRANNGSTAGWAAAVLALAFSVGEHLPAFRTHLSWTRVDAPRYSQYYQIAVFALGVVWYLLNRSTFVREKEIGTSAAGAGNLERLGLYLGLLTGLGLSIRNGAKGWFNIYRQDEEESYWSAQLWKYLGPTYLACLLIILIWILIRPRLRADSGFRPLHAYAAMWLVLIVQNVIAQAITGPLSNWHEMAFSIYYVLLFLITSVVTVHYHKIPVTQSLAGSAN